MKTLYTLALGAMTLAVANIPTSTVQAQALKIPQASPLQTIDQAFALSNIKIEYSRPGVKGRTVFGDVVPWGMPWRTGANSSTKLTFGEDVMVAGKSVKAGSYALYSIPNKDKWEFILSKNTTLGGNVNDYRAEDEVARFTAKPMSFPFSVETFTMSIDNVTPTSCNIELLWDRTAVSFPVTTEIDSRITKNIETALAADTRPYYQAASYYYDNGKDLGQALTWVNKAVEQNPKAFWMSHLKAKILRKQGDNKAAIAAAETSMAAAREAKNDDYVRMNEKLIADAKK